ncbi:hypothetical protein SAMN05216262_11239 [Colwellia chukchiensis]|uniref:Short C-terminal domain-containing protein n=1 Tax=Colwellia chukchiensis TaxID=641665 RepID=A0A1H7QMF0_9GAMM|nr:hypothetical protein [Colwellia chukchiensis]SEL49250.1 hypothetical protein SAMN05216262_11239 [Colwellia chukchiensis]
MEQTSWTTKCLGYLFALWLILLSQPALAQVDNAAQLVAIASLEHIPLANDAWQDVLPVSAHNNSYFLTTKAGKLFLLKENQVNDKPFFDLQAALNNRQIIALNAITLDPSFHYRDSDGYQTFYTAHTEISKTKASKLKPANNELNLPYDAVIMRWQLSQFNGQAPKLNQQHEVMRIAINQVNEPILQLSFNPFIESWQDDYGLLFVALSYSEALQNDPLYAGTILRINPSKFGLLGYMTPVDNPFLKEANIVKETAIIVGQPITHFDWFKRGMHSLLLHITHQDKQRLVAARIGDDWRKAIPKAQIKKDLPLATKLTKPKLYHGRIHARLRGKALSLKQAQSHWLLQPIPLQNQDQSAASSQDPPMVLELQKNNAAAKFSLHQDHDGELLLLEHKQARIYTINASTDINTATTPATPVSTPANNSSGFSLIVMVVIMLSISFWYLKRRHSKRQHFLYQQWSNFQVNTATKSLSLFKRHAKQAETTLDLTTITHSELLLNDELVSRVSAAPEQAFSNACEQAVMTAFAKEHRLKMLDNKQRKIQLRLTLEQKKSQLICLYYRVGNIRHTKLNYTQALNKALDWQWLISGQLNPEATPKRKIKVQLAPPQAPAPKVIPERHNTAATANQTQTNQTNQTHADQTDALVEPQQNEPTGTTDAKLVAALDKLVLLKQQGFLTEQEFSSAKAKILQDLTNN